MKKIFISALMAMMFVSLNSYSQNTSTYSLDKKVDCRVPPKSPPRKLLSKSYKIYTYPGPWTVFDINGDGWCDWVRGGYEGYRLDQEEPAVKDFIYLGGSTGWRYYQSPKNVAHLNFDERWKLKEHSLFSDAGAVAFYEPIPVYLNNERKPYVVTAIRYDAPAPPPGYDRILITRWSDDYDGLKEVPDEEKKVIWNFLKKDLCNRPRDDYEILYGPRIIKRGTLCHAN